LELTERKDMEDEGGEAEEVTARSPSSRWLTPAVKGIGLASFLDDTGHEVTTSLLPRFLSVTLGAPAVALGLIEGIADGVSGFSRIVGGALADDPDHRRSVALGGYASTALLSSAVGVAGNVWTAGALRTAAWSARGLRSPARNALLADAVPSSAYGRAFGFERALDNLGAIAGPLLALFLLHLFGVRTAIVLSIVPGLLAAVAVFYAIRRIPRAPTREQSVRLRLRLGMGGTLRPVMRGIAAFEIGNVAATLLILRATQLLAPARGLERATELALLLYLGYNLAGTLASVLAGRVIDRSDGGRTLVAGVAAFAVAYAMFAVPSANVLLLGGAFIVAGVGVGSVETAEHAVIATRAKEDLRGSAFGTLAAIQSFGNLAASVVAGVIWSAVSPRAAFAYLTGWMVISLILLLRAPRS
jgi:MFS family permease